MIKKWIFKYFETSGAGKNVKIEFTKNEKKKTFFVYFHELFKKIFLGCCKSFSAKNDVNFEQNLAISDH